MRKRMGPIVSLATFAICLLLAELFLSFFARVYDPYEQFKHPQREVNQYIRSEFPVNFRFPTESNEGLSGIDRHSLFTTNNMGFRGDYLAIPKPQSEFRIFMVGGSTTECLYLDDSKAINRVLQDQLSTRVPAGLTVRVYGAGKSGDASPDYISMIVHRITALEPDMIILFSGTNDLSRSVYDYDYLHFVDPRPGQKLPLFKLLATELQIPRRFYHMVKRRVRSDTEVLDAIPSKTEYREKVKVRESMPVSEDRPRTDLRAYVNNLKTIIGVSKAHGIQLVFMTQQSTWNSTVDPNTRNWHWMSFKNGVSFREDYMDQALELFNDQMRQLASEQSIPLHDLARTMPKSLEFFYDDVHFNIKGAYTAGVALSALILERNLITPRK